MLLSLMKNREWNTWNGDYFKIGVKICLHEERWIRNGGGKQRDLIFISRIFEKWFSFFYLILTIIIRLDQVMIIYVCFKKIHPFRRNTLENLFNISFLQKMFNISLIFFFSLSTFWVFQNRREVILGYISYIFFKKNIWLDSFEMLREFFYDVSNFFYNLCYNHDYIVF